MAVIDILAIQVLLAVLALDTLQYLETYSVYHIFRLKNIHEDDLSKQSMAGPGPYQSHQLTS